MQTIFARILLCSSLVVISCTNNEVVPQQKTEQTSPIQTTATQQTQSQIEAAHGHQDGDIGKVKRITISETDDFSHKNDAIIVDVRGVESYKNAHIKGSINIPLSKIERGDLSDFSKISKDKRIITYCS